MGYKERPSKKQKENRKNAKFSRLMAIKRVDIICESLQNGMTSQQIDKRLNSLPKIRPEIREAISLKNVIKALKPNPFISKIIGTSSKGYEDTQLKYDLIALLDGVNMDYVGIQVKSSSKEVINFLKKINPHYPEISNQEVLNKKCLIVLNGQLPASAIQETFRQQFLAINNYFSAKTHA